MRKISLVFFALFALFAFFFSSPSHQSFAQQAVKVRVLNTQDDLDSIKLFSYNPVSFEKTMLAEAAFDSLGEAHLALEIPKHLMAYFEASNSTLQLFHGGQVYLERGYNLALRLVDGYTF